MAATVDVRELNGSGPTPSVVTAAKFCTADNNNPGTSNPIPIVAATTKYSYWKSHELYFTGSFTSITNIDIYCDGDMFDTGCEVYIGDTTLASGSYEQATGTPGDTGNEMVANHTGISARTNLETYTSGSRKTVDAGPITSAGTSSKHVVLQCEVDGDTASPGEKGPETITWQYDEV
jgi:hypothetical protein